jgi:hypothetical protein
VANQTTDEDVAAMADSARRVGLRAEGLLRTLLKAQRRSRHRARTQPLSVTPVVVLWGSARSDVPADATISGVRFLDGRQLLTLLAELDSHDVPRDAAKAALAEPDDTARTRRRPPHPDISRRTKFSSTCPSADES